MANYPNWVASITFRDGADRPSTVQFYVPEATAKLYFAAADKAARDATAVGLLFAAVAKCTSMVIESQTCSVIDVTSPYTLPAEDVLRGNKIVIGYLSGPRQFTLTIPGRDESSYTPKADSVEIDYEAAGDFADFITAFESACLGITGLAVSVVKAYVND